MKIWLNGFIEVLEDEGAHVSARNLLGAGQNADSVGKLRTVIGDFVLVRNPVVGFNRAGRRQHETIADQSAVCGGGVDLNVGG